MPVVSTSKLDVIFPVVFRDVTPGPSAVGTDKALAMCHTSRVVAMVNFNSREDSMPWMAIKLGPRIQPRGH